MTMLGPFFVGDIPATSLIVSITRNGAALDLTPFDGVEMAVTDAAGGVVAWSVTITIDTANSTVTIPFPSTSPFATPGMYDMVLTLTTSSGARERMDPLGIMVWPTAAPEHWCSAAEVYNITRREVTRDNLTKAHFDIEIVSGRLFQRLADGVLCDDDVGWLKRAVAHQAVFVTDHPSKDSSIEVISASEGNASLTPTPDGVFLGAMARRALRNVSWVGARSVNLGNKATTPVVTSLNGDYPDAPWRSE